MASMDAGSALVVPWPRTRAELLAEWSRVSSLAARIGAGAHGAEDLSREERCLLGIWSAARWTVGDLDVAPMTRRVVDPDAISVVEEWDAAARVLSGPGWEFASGVERWLDWLLEAQDRVLYPAV